MATLPRVPIPKNGVDYRGKVVLAPMVRSGELPSRLLALKYGADLVWGPETIDRAMIGCSMRKNERAGTLEWFRYPSHGKAKGPEELAKEGQGASIIYRIHPELEGKKLIYQIGTADPELAVQAADLVGPHVAGVDVNSGCPKPFSTSGGMGAALLSTPDLLCSILTRLVEEVGKKYEIGISVKIRLLPEMQDTKTLVERLVKTGITGLTIHCRTRNMRKTERAIRDQLKMIGEVCKAAGVACLVNGDVDDRDHALELAGDYEVDGGMIATAAEKDPSCFRSKADGGRASWQEMFRAYMEYSLMIENRWGNTKFTLAQILPGKVQTQYNLNKMKNYLHICETFPDLKDLAEKAKELDSLLNITERQTKSEQRIAQREKQNQPKRKAENSKTSEREKKKAKTEESAPVPSTVGVLEPASAAPASASALTA